MNVRIDDDLIAPLAAESPSYQDLERRIDRLLRLVIHLAPTERSLVLSQAVIEALERRLGIYQQIDTPQRLVERVDQLAGIKLDALQFDFSPAQLEEIQRLAERQGCEPDVLVARMLKTLTSEFFKSKVAADAPFIRYVDAQTHQVLEEV